MEKPTVISEPGILLVSKVHCLHSSCNSSKQINWLWRVEASLSSRNGNPPKVGKLVRLIDMLSYRKEDMKADSIYVLEKVILNKVKMAELKWQSNITLIPDERKFYHDVAKSIIYSLETLQKQKYVHKISWRLITSRRRRVSFAGLVRAAVAITHQNRNLILSETTVAKVIAEALDLIDPDNFQQWFSLLYGPIGELCCAVVFNDPSIKSKTESGCKNRFKLPLLVNKEGLIGLYDEMADAVQIVNILNDIPTRNNKIKPDKNTVDSYVLKTLNANVDLSSRPQGISTITENKQKRRCLAKTNMEFQTTIKRGLSGRICKVIDDVLVPGIEIFKFVISLFAAVKPEKLVDAVMYIFQMLHLNVSHYPFVTMLMLYSIQACFIIYLLFLLRKYSKKLFKIGCKIRAGRLKPGWWELILFLFDRTKPNEWQIQKG